MIEKIEIFRAMNGFAVIVGGVTSDMIVFLTWDETIKYLSDQAGLWGKTRVFEEDEERPE